MACPALACPARLDNNNNVRGGMKEEEGDQLQDGECGGDGGDGGAVLETGVAVHRRRKFTCFFFWLKCQKKGE